LEEFFFRLEDMGSSISENQFMIHLLNNLTTFYDLQISLLKKRIRGEDEPLTIEAIRTELSLRFETLSMKCTKIEESEELEDQGLFSVQFKSNCRKCGWIGQKSFQCKNRSNHNGRNNVNTTGGNYCCYLSQTGTFQAELKKKEI
jgi:hypothetical protein